MGEGSGLALDALAKSHASGAEADAEAVAAAREHGRGCNIDDAGSRLSLKSQVLQALQVAARADGGADGGADGMLNGRKREADGGAGGLDGVLLRFQPWIPQSRITDTTPSGALPSHGQRKVIFAPWRRPVSHCTAKLLRGDSCPA